MKRALLLPASCLLLIAGTAPAHWSRPQLQRLVQWIDASADDGLATTDDMVRLRQDLASGDMAQTDAVATRAAQQLLVHHISGCCNSSERAIWHISNGLERVDPASAVADAVDRDQLDELFGHARPSHPFYYALRAAYAREQDPSRKAILAVNLDRWRWMPRMMGARYLIVNTASFEATLWDGRKMTGRWNVVVGKTKSPTPVFAATITGVTLNPWWDIPSDIAAEGIAALVDHDPAAAAKKGYVVDAGRYRQMPGANNALGRMKLVMPNGYNVYLHDTPAQALFSKDVRAFSHGCVRVGDAIGLASVLLGPKWQRDALEGQVASGTTQTLSLPAPVPVYITYFTAEPDGYGGVRYFDDVYHRDIGAVAPGPEGTCPR